MTLQLQRIVPDDTRHDRDGWARFAVLDDDGAQVGFVAEWRDWLGHTYGPPTYTAAHNPTGEDFASLWRSEGHATATEALAALVEHLDGAQ